MTKEQLLNWIKENEEEIEEDWSYDFDYSRALA